MENILTWINSLGVFFLQLYIEILKEAKRTGMTIDELIDSAEKQSALNEATASEMIDRFKAKLNADNSVG